jgi:hypothetical protein
MNTLHSAAETLRSQLATLAQQAHATEQHAHAVRPHTRASKKMNTRLTEEAAAMRGRHAQLEEEAAKLDVRVKAVEEYRAARPSQWGSELPQALMVEILSHVGWGQPGCAAMRLVSTAWCSAHDQHCPTMKFHSFHWAAGAAGTLRSLQRVSSVTVDAGLAPAIQAGLIHCLPQLQSLPSLTSLELRLPTRLTQPVACALGSLTMLTSLKLKREVERLEMDWMELDGDPEDEEVMDAFLGETYWAHTLVLEQRSLLDHWHPALSTLTRLTSLDLSETQNVTNRTIVAVSPLTALASLRLHDGVYVHGLGYWHTSITDEAMRSLANIKSLTSLTLNKAYAVTAAGLMELARLPALKELEYDCMFLGSDTVKALEAARPYLVVVVRRSIPRAGE